ncbi:MAG TPA: YqaE/Pmp3 family membrane protein, partial [Chitinophagaceae bacterium]|nr:YqaE/Pmp3 family membrane protein [Chitinophagaceae bacterium]
MKKKLLTSCMMLSVALIVLMQPSYAISLDPKPVDSTVAQPKAEPESEVVKNAMKEFKSLSRHERKERIKEAKKQLKEFKKQKREGKADEPGTSTILLVILAILLPPVAVWVHQGEINSKFWIDLLLTLLFYLPGLIYALIII